MDMPPSLTSTIMSFWAHPKTHLLNIIFFHQALASTSTEDIRHPNIQRLATSITSDRSTSKDSQRASQATEAKGDPVIGHIPARYSERQHERTNREGA